MQSILGIKLNRNNVIAVGIILVLIAGTAVGVTLVQQRQIFKPKAFETPPVSSPETSLTLLSSPYAQKGDTVRVSLMVRSDIEAANLIAAKLKFPADLLEVKEIRTTEQKCVPPPSCLFRDPRCMIAEPLEGWCPSSGTGNDILSPDKEVKGVQLAQTIPCNYDEVSLKANPNAAGVGDTINFIISGDASTWVGDDYGGGVSGCQGTWNNTSCKAVKPGNYTWQHTWKKCIGSFNNCSTTCSSQIKYTVADGPTPSSPIPTPYGIFRFFIKNWVENTFDNNAGIVSLVGGVPNPGFKTDMSCDPRGLCVGTDSGLMAEIIFTVKAPYGVATISFDEDSAIYANSNNENILKIKRETNIGINYPPVSMTPSPTASISASPSPTIKPGDINGDGLVNLIDMSILLSRWGKKGEAAGRADINGDKVVNSIDYSMLIKLLIENGIIKGASDLPSALQIPKR